MSCLQPPCRGAGVSSLLNASDPLTCGRPPCPESSADAASGWYGLCDPRVRRLPFSALMRRSLCGLGSWGPEALWCGPWEARSKRALSGLVGILLFPP